MTRSTFPDRILTSAALAASLAAFADAQEEILFVADPGITAGYGTAVSGAGDVDGDGFPDLVVGHVPAAHGLPSPVDRGGFHVVSGRTGAALLSIEAKAAAEWDGLAVVGLGDVDGDGVPDVAIGAPRTPANGLGSGAVRIRSAATGATSVLLVGAQPNDRFGWAVDVAGDVNNDGVLDVIVGAPGVSIGPIAAGAATVHSGADGAALLTISGTTPFAELGRSVAGVGDADGDGVDDVAVGSPLDDTPGENAGSVRVVSGSSGATLWTTDGGPLSSLGWALAAAGDVDQDGRPDLLVGEPGVSAAAPSSGAARVLSGATGATVRTFAAPVKSAGQGTAVAAAGDVDGDGVPDVAVGSPDETSTDVGSGAVRVWSGLTGALLSTAYGETPGEALGDAVAGVADVDLDGRPDLAVGRPKLPFGAFPAGAVSVHSDCPGGFARFGSSCQGTNGLAPLLNAQGCAVAGGEVRLRLSVAKASSTAFLFVGATAGSTPLPNGCALLVASPAPLAPTLPTDVDGRALVSIPIPASVGPGTVVAQAFVVDPGAPSGFSATNGVSVTFE